MQRFRPVELAAGPFRLRLARDADVDAALEMSRDPAIAQWYSTGVVDRRSARRWLRNGVDWSVASATTQVAWVPPDQSAPLRSQRRADLRSTTPVEYHWAIAGSRDISRAASTLSLIHI